MIPFEYFDRRGDRTITHWPLERVQIRQVKGLLTVLSQLDTEQAIGSVIHKLPGISGIYYAKINGNVALRPRCCVGLASNDRVTFLERVRKVGGAEEPAKINSNAPERMRELQAAAPGNGDSVPITMHVGDNP